MHQEVGRGSDQGAVNHYIAEEGKKQGPSVVANLQDSHLSPPLAFTLLCSYFPHHTRIVLCCLKDIAEVIVYHFWY